MVHARAVKAIGWLAVFAPLPYSLSRVLWAAGAAVGIDRGFLDDMGAPGVGSIFLLTMAALTESVAVLTATIVVPRARRVPAWVPRIGGRPVNPRLVVGLLLLPLTVLAWRGAAHVPLAFDGFKTPSNLEDMPPWSLWAHIGVTWTWTVSLAATTFLYARDAGGRPAPRRRARSSHPEAVEIDACLGSERR